MRDPTLDEMRAYLATTPDDDFDREEAIYWFAANYHAGQDSSRYSALSQSEFHPGAASDGPGNDQSIEFYMELVAEYAP